MNHVSLAAPAKINLRLTVLAREESGYHSLETILCGISLADEVVVERTAEGFHLDVIGEIETGPPDRNLVRRAALRFYEALGLEPAVRIRLEKVIPAAAGLGGGSSDAAATLRALNALHGFPFDDRTLLGWGGSLGSDVPFFLGGSPFALAWGRGERLLELTPLPSRPVLIVHPGIEIPTAAAFSRLAELRSSANGAAPLSRPATIDASQLSAWNGLTAIAENDFHVVAAERVKGFATLIDRLREGGATIAMLSGSGSAVFAIFDTIETLAESERVMRGSGFATFRASTLDRWPVPRFRD